MTAKILICDDDSNLRESIRDNLELEGYDIVEAGDGGGAVKAVEKTFFDVILMDYHLPDMTGIDAIHKIRKVSADSQILMLTAHASLDTALRAIQESVYDFLVKPVDFEHLKRSISKSVDRLALERENRRLVVDLRKANEEMLYLSNMKSKFLSMASHDLSNVLMTLQVSFEMLMSSITPDKEQEKRLGYITNGLTQLARLIEDLVDWASIEQGKFRLEKKLQSVKQLVEDSVGAITGRALQRGITLKAEVAKGLKDVEVDKRRFSQVLGNLLENALRHTKKGGKVTVSAVQAETGLRFSVVDTGEGIDQGELKKIFDSFYQPDGSDQHGRLGLGLSISREIIHSHGGKIWVESEGHGKGASFLFTIPNSKKK